MSEVDYTTEYSATYLHLIVTKVPAVLCLVLQRVLTHVNEVDQSGPAFCNRSTRYKPTANLVPKPEPTVFLTGNGQENISGIKTAWSKS